MKYPACILNGKYAKGNCISIAFANENQIQDLTENTSEEKVSRSYGPGTVEYYMKDIPVTKEEKQRMRDNIQEDMFNIGLILKNDLEDFKSSETEFKKLLSLYPDNIYRLDIYHNLFLLYARTGDLNEAERYRKLIVRDFPDSPLGIAMKNPDYLDHLKQQEKEQESLYEAAYRAYINNLNDSVHSLTDYMKEIYPLSILMPKFLFIDALSYAADHNAVEFKKRMIELLEKFPESDVISVAAGIYKNYNEGRNFGESATNLKGIVRSESLITEVPDRPPTLEEYRDSLFKLDKGKPHLIVFAFPSDEVSSNQLLYDLARHNFTTFIARVFDLESQSVGESGLILIRGFNNLKEAEYYLKNLYNDKELNLPSCVMSLQISEADFKTLLDNGLSFDDYLNAIENSRYRSAQEKVLSADEYEIENLD